MTKLEMFDTWLGDKGPAALILREHLTPVEGPDGVFFPPTFAAGDGFPGGYNIDVFPDGKNICLIDSVGSQANRIEPLFAKEEYAGLSPQIVVIAGQHRINLLEAGHRAGDAIVRCSELQESLRAAFQSVQKGDAVPLAKIAPTSLVFGAWDSRETQAKLPRLVASTIRAYDVRVLRRSAQYVPATDYIGESLLPAPDDKAAKAYSERGFGHVPATASHGGVIASGGIRRDASLHLSALRLLSAGSDAAATLALRRYVLGLALTAFTYTASGYLRQGCNLVLDAEKARVFQEVYADGKRQNAQVTHADSVAYGRAAAAAFGIGPDREVTFDRELAAKDVSGEEKTAKRARKAKA